eukprot:TRINITY_DN83_c3_g1_i1.p1 TRINITY_DN83_c3_g1~~TRINITY_DN83_c3_g1_i1.p1  ORF type:complete len:148 (+),score=16.40 TRINITY_DN83_c3_g1_i1:597-1040(+)
MRIGGTAGTVGVAVVSVDVVAVVLLFLLCKEVGLGAPGQSPGVSESLRSNNCSDPLLGPLPSPPATGSIGPVFLGNAALRNTGVPSFASIRDRERSAPTRLGVEPPDDRLRGPERCTSENRSLNLMLWKSLFVAGDKHDSCINGSVR